MRHRSAQNSAVGSESQVDLTHSGCAPRSAQSCACVREQPGADRIEMQIKHRAGAGRGFALLGHNSRTAGKTGVDMEGRTQLFAPATVTGIRKPSAAS